MSEKALCKIPRAPKSNLNEYMITDKSRQYVSRKKTMSGHKLHDHISHSRNKCHKTNYMSVYKNVNKSYEDIKRYM